MSMNESQIPTEDSTQEVFTIDSSDPRFPNSILARFLPGLERVP